MTNILHLSWLLLNLTNFIIRIEPNTNNLSYYTNYGGTNLIINGQALYSSMIGPTVLLTWNEQHKLTYIQYSDDLINFYDIRIVNIGATNMYLSPLASQQRFYRFRCE